MPLDVLVEALLFYKATPQKIVTLKKLFAADDAAWDDAIIRLKERLSTGALRVLETDSEIQLVTAAELSEFIEALRKDELHGDIGKAGAETLAIVLYKGPVTRAEIDRIRGVNSSFILRNLLIRGLVERKPAKNTYQFSTSAALLQQLGIEHKEQLPGFAEFMNTLENLVPHE